MQSTACAAASTPPQPKGFSSKSIIPFHSKQTRSSSNSSTMNLKSILLACGLVLLMTLGARANNMLVQNVTTLGNDAVNKTIQVQFDISWDNSWRDSINYDAAWIFMKFKNASGVWQHVQLNQTGFVNGTGTANTVQVTSDKVGSWLCRSALGSGTFNSTAMQLQWNYGLAGLTNVTGLEVRVFAVEMVYVPEGEFNVAKGFRQSGTRTFSAPGNNFPVINQRLTPVLSYNDGTAVSLRLKGDAGIDTNSDGVIDNTTYPIGYRSFYAFKFEMTEQQYADFLNTLGATQIATLGIAGLPGGITLTNGQYFSSQPNRACGNSNASTLLPANRLLAYSDWAGLRPMTILEFNKASYGPLQPIAGNYGAGTNYNYAAWGSSGRPTGYDGQTTNNTLVNVGFYGSSITDRTGSGASYYGLLDLTGNASEPVVGLSNLGYGSANGNGILSASGLSDEQGWSSSLLIWIDMDDNWASSIQFRGFRYVRSAE